MVEEQNSTTMKNTRTILTGMALGVVFPLLAQSTGEIHGKVLDGAGAPQEFAVVSAEQGSMHYGATTDEGGRYVLKPLPTGTYTVRASFVGVPTVAITGVVVDAGLNTTMDNIVLSAVMEAVPVIGWREPLIRKDDPSRMVMNTTQIKKNAGRKDPVKMIASFTPGVTKAPNGDGLYFRGSRTGSMCYYVDGVKMDALSGVPPDAINSISVYTGGLPARYGDVTGGVIAIDTKSYFDLYQQRNSETK